MPSSIRVVRVGVRPSQFAANFSTAGSQILEWPAKHPLDADWWWVDATGWLTDPAGTIWDTIGMVATPTTLSDAALTIDQTIISADGTQAGVHFLGGTPNLSNAIRIVLTTAKAEQQWAGDIVLPIQNVAPIVANPPNIATLHGSVVMIGGLRFPFPA